MVILLNEMEVDESIFQVDVLKLLDGCWMKSQFLVYADIYDVTLNPE